MISEAQTIFVNEASQSDILCLSVYESYNQEPAKVGIDVEDTLAKRRNEPC